MSSAFAPVLALEAYHDALNAHDVVRIRPLFADDAHYRSEGIGEVVGRAAILSALTAYFDLHPDHRAWDEDVRQLTPEKAWSRWRLTATNRLTGITIQRSGTETVTFDAEGHIVLIEAIDD